MAMNWDDLRVFLAVARRGSLSAAARELKVTQPTVGRRLKSLEERLSARLFDRLPDGFVLTAAGAELLQLAETMESAADAVERRQAAFADSVEGTVRLSIGEVMAQFLTDHLSELRARLPAIELELAVAHVSANLSRREADLLLRDFAIYGARNFVEAHPAARGAARFGDCAWIGFDEEHGYFPGQKWLLERLEGRVPALRVNNAMVLHDAVRKGAGLGVLPCFAADRDPVLARLTAPLPEVTSPQHLLVHRDLRRSPSVRAVMDALAELFKRETPRLLGRPALVVV
jgi:DNA-binding transcriptional LysR family regulator